MVTIQERFAGHAALGRLEPTDGARLRRFFFSLSPQTVYRRFLSPIARPEQLEKLHLLDVDGDRRQALVAVVGGEIVGVARYARDTRRRDVADLAIVVADAWQGQGLGTRLLGALAEVARGAGVDGFSFITLPDNRAAVRLLRRLAPDTHVALSGGVLEGYAPLRPA